MGNSSLVEVLFREANPQGVELTLEADETLHLTWVCFGGIRAIGIPDVMWHEDPEAVKDLIRSSGAHLQPESVAFMQRINSGARREARHGEEVLTVWPTVHVGPGTTEVLQLGTPTEGEIATSVGSSSARDHEDVPDVSQIVRDDEEQEDLLQPDVHSAGNKREATKQAREHSSTTCDDQAGIETETAKSEDSHDCQES